MESSEDDNDNSNDKNDNKEEEDDKQKKVVHEYCGKVVESKEGKINYMNPNLSKVDEDIFWKIHDKININICNYMNLHEEVKALSIMDRKAVKKDQKGVLMKLVNKVSCRPEFKKYFDQKKVKNPGHFIYRRLKDNECLQSYFDPFMKMQSRIMEAILMEQDYFSDDEEGVEDRANLVQVIQHCKYVPHEYLQGNVIQLRVQVK
mmetsp:Transcript_14423/g.21253  ORF Transcript_14423/g.21253 Transcript_14423/m.21253 type:complete len:204 (+) Transcript_14423:652-1263(+)